MSGIFNNQDDGLADLGKPLMSWMYKPKKSNKFLFYLLGLLGAAVIFFLAYGSDWLPWLRKVPEYAVYILFLVFGPVVNFLRSKGKDQEWTLYEYGFVVRYLGQNKSGAAGSAGYWRDYKSAIYSSNKVILIPVSSTRRKIKIPVDRNVIPVYSLCRERVSIAQSAALQGKMRRPTTPDTPEQRRIARMERRIRGRSRSLG